MTAIADADLQRLFAAAINEQQLAQGIVNTSHDAFCAALNERLEAVERMAQALTLIAGTGADRAECSNPRYVAAQALSAYRQSKEHR